MPGFDTIITKRTVSGVDLWEVSNQIRHLSPPGTPHLFKRFNCLGSHHMSWHAIARPDVNC